MTTQEQIDLCALRYALGRMTYIVSEVTEYLAKKAGSLSKQSRDLMIKDIATATNYGHSCDFSSWMKLLRILEEAK